ncbi:MAG: aminopeptidase [Chloroflexota bacterium]
MYNNEMMTNSSNNPSIHDLKERFAELTIRMGLNLQSGQSVRLSAELAHREFVHYLVQAAYRAGAPYVHIEWNDDLVIQSRLNHASPDALQYFPEFEVARYRQMADEKWARLAVVGPEYPNAFDDIKPQLVRMLSESRATRTKFYSQAQMANDFQWCLVAAPTAAWAKKIYPQDSEADAIDRLWQMILKTSRVDQPNPIDAWDRHDRQLRQLTHFMAEKEVRSIRYLDRELGPDGQPATDLTVGLTAHPVWIGGSEVTTDGIRFFPNMPTEEIFSTPHRMRVTGWARTSRPTFPFGREVSDAWFRFEEGEVKDFGAQVGAEVLEQFFEIDGTRRLGEVSLVDVDSPINQTGLIFHEILFDENAVCHIAFGEAYPDGMANSKGLSPDELEAAGVNQSDAHLDFMIGTATMDVIGTCADGSQVNIMEQGHFTMVNGE